MNLQTPHGRLTTRAETGDDADSAFLFALFTSTKAAEMALMPVSDSDKMFLLRMQYRSMTRTYRAQFPQARFEIVELDAKPIGRLITDVQPDCVHYVDIALMPERSGVGIATILMTEALDEPRRLGLPGRVKVMSGNVASLRLCQRLGMTLRANIPPFVELEWQAAD